MDCKILGHVVDVRARQIVDAKSGKVSDWFMVTVLDVDAYMEQDRFSTFWVKPEVLSGIDVKGKDCLFVGVLTRDRGYFKVKVREVSLVK
jgi:hypothetical protein